MPAVVNDGCVRLWKLAKDNLNFWFAVGRITPWSNENNPPAENVAVETIDEIQGLKKVDTIQFVKEDLNGTIVINTAEGLKRFGVVAEADIYDQDAVWLYFSAWLIFDTFPVITFRQTALFVDVVPVTGHETDDVLLPEEVVNYGKMIAYVNHAPRTRVAYGKDLLEFVIKLEGQVTALP